MPSVGGKDGTKKEARGAGVFIEDYGLEGDDACGAGIARQVSLFPEESIDKMRALGLELNPGTLPKNLTVEAWCCFRCLSGRDSGSGVKSFLKSVR